MSIRNACFTSFLPELKIDTTKVKYYVYQREQCPDTGRLHYQGYVELTTPMRRKAIQTVLGDAVAHIAKRKGTQAQAINYCTKDESRVEEPVHWGEPARQGRRTDIKKAIERIADGEDIQDIITDTPHLLMYRKQLVEHKREVDNTRALDELRQDMSDVELRPFQQTIMDMLEVQTERQVLWIYDPVGGAGKSFLSKYLQVRHNAFRCENGPKKDIAYAYNREPIFIMDLARCCEERVNYDAIESMCNGQIFSAKYASEMKIFRKPKMLILSNFMPMMEALSADRWVIHTVSSNED